MDAARSRFSLREYPLAPGGDEVAERRGAAVPVHEIHPEGELRLLEGLDDPAETGYGQGFGPAKRQVEVRVGLGPAPDPGTEGECGELMCPPGRALA